MTPAIIPGDTVRFIGGRSQSQFRVLSNHDGHCILEPLGESWVKSIWGNTAMLEIVPPPSNADIETFPLEQV
jgi:hypothetical protein